MRTLDHITTLEELQAYEAEQRTLFEATFNDFAKPFQEKFDIDTAEHQKKVREELQPYRERMNDTVTNIRKKAEQAVDKAVSKYMVHQKRSQTWFDKATAVEREALLAATADKKAELEAEWKIIEANISEKLAEINKVTKE